LIAQITQLQQQLNAHPQTPPQAPQTQPNPFPQQPPVSNPPMSSQSPQPSLSPQKLMELNMMENELNNLKQAITRMENSIKKLKE
jgi:hypothetical protein